MVPAMSDSRIPIFPLNTVLFPGGMLPLRVFETRYMDMTSDCLRRGRPFGVCLIREGREVGAPATPEPVGCLAHITDCDMQQLGLLQLKTLGGQRFRILGSRTEAQGLIRADIEMIPIEAAIPLPDRFISFTRLLERLAAEQDPPIFAEPHGFGDAAWVGYRLSEILPAPLAVKQMLLELGDSLARLDILQRFLTQLGLDPS